MVALPVAPAVTLLSQGACELAVNAHVGALAVTLMEPVCPAPDAAACVAESVNAQPSDCETVKVCPAMVSVPVRGPATLAAAV